MTKVADRVAREAFARAERPRRVLVYAPLAYSTPHFETDLEIAQRHIDLGDKVELLLCDAELTACQLNPTADPRRCIQCVSRNLQGGAQLSARLPIIGLLEPLTSDDRARLAGIPRQFPDQEALRKYRFDGFDAGLATLSSLIDFTRTPTIDLPQYAGVVYRLLHDAIATYLALRRLLARARYDRVYIYNGRWSMMRSAVRACEELEVPYYTHERGADFRKFALYRDVLPQDKGDFRVQTALAWEDAAQNPERAAVGATFFQERRQRVEKNWFSYVKQQDAGRVPPDWAGAGRRVVLFTSSEFEYAAIGEAATGRIYANQTLGARRIAQHLAQVEPDTRLWIRVHPNDNTPDTARRWAESVRGLGNVTLIQPGEKTDSYALLDGADRVVTFGSTIGIEATYWGKPAVCADHSFFDGLDAQYEAATEGELFALISQAGLAAKPQENALRYGYYLNTFGAEFEHFVTDAISDYEFRSPFRGRCLKPDYDDLRQRLIALHREGEVRRSLAIANLCLRFKPDDGLAWAVRILSLLQLQPTANAVGALEEAAAKMSAAQAEQLLKQVGRALLDGAMRLSKDGPPEEFQDVARRIGDVMQRTPVFAEMGRKLMAMASRSATSQAALGAR